MKITLHIQFSSEPAERVEGMLPDFGRSRVDAANASPNPKLVGGTPGMVLVILPDGKVVRRPEPSFIASSPVTDVNAREA